MRAIYWFATLIIRAFMKVSGNYRIINRERLHKWRGCIVASNHMSYFDPPFIGSVMPAEIHYLAKSELFKIPIFGSIIRFFNAIPVKRGVFDKGSLERIKNLLSEKGSILIFPEGSRKSFSAKAGIGILAHELQVPILPVYIENSHKLSKCLFSKKRLNIYIGEWIEPEEFNEMPAEKNTYRHIANEILKRINRLPNESKIS